MGRFRALTLRQSLVAGALMAALVALAGCAKTPDHPVSIVDIHGLALDPQDPTRLYVATHHGLYVGENDTQWSAVTQEPFDMMGFTMHPTNARVMYASGHPARAGGLDWSVGVVKSTDGGRTWTTLGLKNEVDFHALAMEPGGDEADTLYGFYRGRLYWSADGGSQWDSSPANFSVFALAVAAETGRVDAATDQGLQSTGRLGAGGWRSVAAGAAWGVAASSADSETLVAYFATGGLKRSFDGGKTWEALNWTVSDDDRPWGIALHPTDLQTLYGGTAKGQIYKTTDGGAAWVRIR